jgi:hypothetical protein
MFNAFDVACNWLGIDPAKAGEYVLQIRGQAPRAE